MKKQQLIIPILALSLALGTSLTAVGAAEDNGATSAASNINIDNISMVENLGKAANSNPGSDGTSEGVANSTKVQELRALTLEVALQLAVENNSSLRTAKFDLDKKEIAARQAAKQLHDISDDLKKTREMDDAVYNDKSKKFELDLAKESYELAKKKLEYTIKNNYFSALKAREQIKQSKTALELAEKELIHTKIALSLGIASDPEVQSAEAAAISARARLTDTEAAYREAEFTLSSALGLPAATRYNLTSTAIYQPAGEIDLEAIISEALANRLDIFEKEGKNELALMNYDIVAGFSAPNTYAARQAKASAEQAKLSLEDTRDNIVSDITRAHQKLQELQKQLDINAQALKTSKQNHYFATVRYGLGRISKMDLLAASASLEKSESAWSGALYDFELARVSFELCKLAPAN